MFYFLVIHKDISIAYFRQKIVVQLSHQTCRQMPCHYLQIYNTLSQEKTNKQKAKKETTVEHLNSFFPSLRMICILRTFWKTIEDRSKI